MNLYIYTTIFPFDYTAAMPSLLDYLEEIDRSSHYDQMFVVNEFERAMRFLEVLEREKLCASGEITFDNVYVFPFDVYFTDDYASGDVCYVCRYHSGIWYIGSYSPIEALANYMVSTTKIMEETEGM
jgi:hypothetical protein